jgi:tetratricopeptide (TPR) repeat protein
MIARLAVCGALTVLVAACATPRRPTGPLPSSAPTSVEGLVAAIQADSALSDHASDGQARTQLADEASAYAQACLTEAPQAAGCLYGRGLALGLQARAHPTSAGASLKDMLDALSKADAADPNYDQAGPSRVRALVLLRAPGWPLGPGDADSGLTAARRAVELRPQYPPNLLALGEALAKTGDATGAREAYTRARDEAQALPANKDRDGWLREADQGLQRK